MNVFTSNFKSHGRSEHAVAVSCGVPRWFRGRRMPALAPERKMISEPEETYRPYYAGLLAALDVHAIAAELGDGAILLCWEKPGEFCHRQMIADWLRAAGHTVTEIAK